MSSAASGDLFVGERGRLAAWAIGPRVRRWIQLTLLSLHPSTNLDDVFFDGLEQTG
jgi:hypothetical protein